MNATPQKTSILPFHRFLHHNLAAIAIFRRRQCHPLSLSTFKGEVRWKMGVRSMATREEAVHLFIRTAALKERL